MVSTGLCPTSWLKPLVLTKVTLQVMVTLGSSSWGQKLLFQSSSCRSHTFGFKSHRQPEQHLPQNSSNLIVRNFSECWDSNLGLMVRSVKAAPSWISRMNDFLTSEASSSGQEIIGLVQSSFLHLEVFVRIKVKSRCDECQVWLLRHIEGQQRWLKWSRIGLRIERYRVRTSTGIWASLLFLRCYST